MLIYVLCSIYWIFHILYYFLYKSDKMHSAEPDNLKYCMLAVEQGNDVFF